MVCCCVYCLRPCGRTREGFVPRARIGRIEIGPGLKQDWAVDVARCCNYHRLEPRSGSDRGLWWPSLCLANYDGDSSSEPSHDTTILHDPNRLLGIHRALPRLRTRTIVRERGDDVSPRLAASMNYSLMPRIFPLAIFDGWTVLPLVILKCKFRDQWWYDIRHGGLF